MIVGLQADRKEETKTNREGWWKERGESCVFSCLQAATFPGFLLEVTIKKVCSKCGREKSVFEFRQCGKGHRRGDCKDCCSEYEKRIKGTSRKNRYSGWRKNHPEKRLVNSRLQMAVARGKINKPSFCQICKQPMGKVDLCGHHYDYNKPFEVIWVCRKCHSKIHNAEAI